MAASRAWVAAGKAAQTAPVLSGKCRSQRNDARCSASKSWPAVAPRGPYSNFIKGGTKCQCRYNVADLYGFDRHNGSFQHRLASRAQRERVVRVSAISEQGVTVVVGAKATEEAPASDNAGTDVQAVLFDMDGVLCDSEDRSRQAAVELFKELGFEVTEEDFIPFMGTGEANFLGGVARKFGVPDWDVTKAKARFFEIYIGKYALPDSGLGYSGAIELIQAVKQAGLKAAVASSADLVKVNANLAAAGLPLTNFDAVVSADLFERLKPSPDIFLAASKALGVAPSQCVVIEDALAGVQAARAAGMRCIGVTTTLDAAALAPGEPALVRKDISHITLDDILNLKYPSSNNDDQNETPAQLLKELKQSGGKEGIAEGLRNVLNATVDLPGGFSTRRRDVLRLGAGLIGLTSTYIAFTRAKNQPDVRAWLRTKGWWLAWVWQAAIIAYCVRAFPYWRKAMSYVSPRAVLNQLFGAPAPGVAEAAEDRVKQFKKYIRDMEKRGGGTTVPEFQQGLPWLNTAPLKLSKELRGRVLVFDFWTYCCINCMHILPDLAFLEKKYKDQPVTVVGIHSAKFDNEKDTEAIREAVLRYDVVHPVVNDGEMTMWRALGVSSWPTLAVVSPKGKLLAMLAGEGHRQDIDELLQAALEYYGEQGDLKNDPLPISLEKDKDSRVAKSPLRFPGKIATDLKNKRLFISDSSQHRIVVTDLKGNFITQIGGGGGEGLRDGAFEYAAFNRPQGLAYHSGRDLLYVADTENHAFREVNLGSGMVRTLAGNGKQGRDYKGGGSGPTQLLNSPWDVVVDEARNVAYVAMAGQHQLWKYDIAANTIGQFSGDGYERNLNGPSGTKSSFAQPSGLSLTPDGSSMYVADSESSSVRVVNTATGGSQSNVGGDPYFSDNLFQFGDVDGQGGSARLQHPLGVLFDPAGGKVFVADSYNHKVKIMDPSKNSVQTLAGTGKPGFRDGTGGEVQFSEPNGLALGEDGDVYVADTNNSLIRVIHTRDGNKVSTLSLSGVPPPPEAPAAARRKRRAVDTELVKVDEVSASSGNLVLQISLPPSYHYTQGATSKYEVESDPSNGVTVQPAAGDLSSARDGPSATLKFTRSSTTASSVRINCKVYYCEDSDTVCLFKGVTFEVPFSPSGSPSNTVTLPYLVTPDKTPSNVTNSFLIKP